MPKGDNNRKLSDAQIQEIIHLYSTPLPDGSWLGITLIGRRFSVCQSTIRRHLRKHGIIMRSAKEAHAHGKRCKSITNLPQGTPLPCKCGCGQEVTWDRNNKRWHLFVIGHYRPDAPYKHRDWLVREYVQKGRSGTGIAKECGVCHGTIYKFMRKFGIPRRSQPESLVLSGAVRGANNPAWKGGIAQWEYSPGWKRKSRLIRKRDDYTCQICHTQFPKSTKLLHVHHIDGDRYNDDDSNLITVCATCHPKGKRKEAAFAMNS